MKLEKAGCSDQRDERSEERGREELCEAWMKTIQPDGRAREDMQEFQRSRGERERLTCPSELDCQN